MFSRQHARDKRSSNLTLQHMLSAAPRLLQLIPKQDLKAKTVVLNADLDWDIHALASAQWPKLAVLDLSSLYLRAYDIQILASAHLPSLTAVNLAGNELIEDAIKELVKASWPRLERLNLSWQDYSYTSSGSTFAAYLVKGEWPLLKTLDISGGYVCIGHLLNGKWPALEDPILLDMFHDEDAPTIVKDTSGLAWPNLRRRSLSGGAVSLLWQSGHAWNLCVLMVFLLKMLHRFSLHVHGQRFHI